MEPRRSDTQLQVTKGFHLEKNQPRTGQGVKEARGSWDVTWRIGLYGRNADLSKGVKRNSFNMIHSAELLDRVGWQKYQQI